jgi:hypothetical protein
MPNHLHGIIVLTDNAAVGAGLGGCLKSRISSRLNLEFIIRGAKGSGEVFHE